MSRSAPNLSRIDVVGLVTALGSQRPQLRYELQAGLPRSIYTAIELRTTVDARLARGEAVCEPSDGVIVPDAHSSLQMR